VGSLKELNRTFVFPGDLSNVAKFFRLPVLQAPSSEDSCNLLHTSSSNSCDLNTWQATCIETDREAKLKMLYYALVFLVIAVIAAILGFGTAAAAFAGVAKILFFIFLVLFVVSLVMHLGRRV